MLKKKKRKTMINKIIMALNQSNYAVAACLTVVATFFAPIWVSLIAIFILVLIDLVVGVIASLRRGERIQSSKLKLTVIKLFLYEIAVVTARLIEVYFLPFFPLINIIVGCIGTTEMVSIFENISKVTQTNFIKFIKDHFNKVFDKKIQK